MLSAREEAGSDGLPRKFPYVIFKNGNTKSIQSQYFWKYRVLYTISELFGKPKNRRLLRKMLELDSL